MSQPQGPTTGPSNLMPFDLLSPDIAAQLHLESYVFAGATAVYIWDMLNHLKEDYSVVFKTTFRASTVAYIFSRIASLFYILGFAIFTTYPVGACNRTLIVLNTFYPISVGSTALLFFFRVRAVYGNQRSVVLIFAALWLTVLAGSLTCPIGARAVAIGATRGCIIARIPEYMGSAAITVSVHDTAVFLAISYRLLANSHVEHSCGEKVRALFRGGNLPAFSKALFVDGQKYYMITVISNILTASMVYIPGTSPVYHGILSIPNIALTSIMACRVYRHAKLHRPADALSLPMISDYSVATNGFTLPLSVDSNNLKSIATVPTAYSVHDSGFSSNTHGGGVPG
ncbi:hypothetical protein C8R43DRAFT_1073089 [Mycena crocata]|nr:hypothetical protein C8R43DRAFT_1073089 [Mycena crocata]